MAGGRSAKYSWVATPCASILCKGGAGFRQPLLPSKPLDLQTGDPMRIAILCERSEPKDLSYEPSNSFLATLHSPLLFVFSSLATALLLQALFAVAADFCPRYRHLHVEVAR